MDGHGPQPGGDAVTTDTPLRWGWGLTAPPGFLHLLLVLFWDSLGWFFPICVRVKCGIKGELMLFHNWTWPCGWRGAAAGGVECDLIIFIFCWDFSLLFFSH